MCHARIKVSDNMSTNSFFTLGLMSNIAWQRVEVFERYEIHSVLTPNTLNQIRQSQMLLKKPWH